MRTRSYRNRWPLSNREYAHGPTDPRIGTGKGVGLVEWIDTLLSLSVCVVDSSAYAPTAWGLQRREERGL